MQLEKTDGPTHPDDITGNDADAGKIPPPKKQRTLRCRFGTIPTADHAPPCLVRRGRETERRTDAPQPFYFLLDRLPAAKIVTA